MEYMSQIRLRAIAEISQQLIPVSVSADRYARGVGGASAWIAKRVKATCAISRLHASKDAARSIDKIPPPTRPGHGSTSRALGMSATSLLCKTRASLGGWRCREAGRQVNYRGRR